MKDAKIFKDEGGLYVQLYCKGDFFGTVDVREHSMPYAKEVVHNWITGVLTEDNPHIERIVCNT